MMQVQSVSRQACVLLAVLCGSPGGMSETKQKLEASENQAGYPFPELVSAGNLEVQLLANPSNVEFREAMDSFRPEIVYLRGEQHGNNDEIGALVWGGVHVSSDLLLGLFQSSIPNVVYLEIPEGEKLVGSLHSKGIPYVIYWKNSFSCFTASHFRHTMLSVLQSSTAHIWDAFKLARASFDFYCARNCSILPSNNRDASSEFGPCLLGDPPKINLSLSNYDGEEDNQDASLDSNNITVHDPDVHIRLLLCGEPCPLDDGSLSSLEDGLNALLNIEIRGSKLHNRVSAPPPPLQAGIISRGVVTMRCDMSTCSSAYVSLLVSGSAATCFDDQVLENHIKNEIVDTSQLVHVVPECDLPFEPRRSMSVACGAPVFQICMKVPVWASQVLRQVALDPAYRSLVILGIACIQGLPVASFGKDDADRLLFFSSKDRKAEIKPNFGASYFPHWLKPPLPRRTFDTLGVANGVEKFESLRRKCNIAAMRPVPRVHHRKMMPFSVTPEVSGPPIASLVAMKNNMLVNCASKHTGLVPFARRKAITTSVQAKPLVPLNPLPLRKHGCDRCPIRYCSEEEFLKDVMQFLALRGHNRLIPQSGLAEFPDAILNAKRLDLYNLYREVVSRGGFHVGNGINWKGQVFSKMRNYTTTNRMTGVGNTLKRHYETYLLEYELAHDDVDGECCLLCRSSAAGDWVNCGVCGEWAHFGCDRRQGLGAFKDYAKTDGLEYICPNCSSSSFKKRVQKV